MSGSSSDAVQYVTVVCRVCGTRVDERVIAEDREVPCPDCYTPVKIPGRARIVAPLPPPKIEDPGVYRLNHEEPVERKGRGAAAPKRPKEPEPLLVTCPLCRCRMHPPIRRESYKVRCPDCYRAVRVPGTEEAARLREQRKRLEPKLEAIEPIPLRLESKVPPRVATQFTLEGVRIREAPPSPPPRWTWMSGILTFPWQREIIRRWLILSIGMFLLLGASCLVAMMLLSGNPLALLSAAFIIVPGVWLFLWTGSYAASAWMTVVVDTAGGNHTVPEWEDETWRDGLFPGLALLFQCVIAALFGEVLGRAAAHAGVSYQMVRDVVFLLAIPFLILSMLETTLWYFPFSRRVARSLGTHFRDWCLFYLVHSTLIGGAFYLSMYALRHWGLTAVVPGGPMWAALVLISGRLFGRLGWRITEDREGPDEPHPNELLPAPSEVG